jgi:hypothetical protein
MRECTVADQIISSLALPSDMSFPYSKVNGGCLGVDYSLCEYCLFKHGNSYYFILRRISSVASFPSHTKKQLTLAPTHNTSPIIS